MAGLIVIGIGIASVTFTIFLLYKTYLALGTFGIFAGGKSRFSGVADAKYTKRKASLLNAKNLNGTTIRVLKLKKNVRYKINCNIETVRGEVSIILKDKKRNEVLNTSENIQINYKDLKNRKIFVTFIFHNFYGNVNCKLLEQ